MIAIAGYVVDVAVNEEITLTADATPHPIEGGAEATDHVIVRPKRISVTCVVSDTPIGEIAELREASGLFVGQNAEGFIPSDDAHRFLEDLIDAAEPFTYEGVRAVYDNMVMLSVSEPTSAQTGDALSFSCTMQQMLIRQTERTTVEVERPRSKRRVNRGNKPSGVFEVGDPTDVLGGFGTDEALQQRLNDATSRWIVQPPLLSE